MTSAPIHVLTVWSTILLVVGVISSMLRIVTHLVKTGEEVVVEREGEAHAFSLKFSEKKNERKAVENTIPPCLSSANLAVLYFKIIITFPS